MIKNKKRESLLDNTGAKNFFNQIMDLWISPELEKRRENNAIDKDFKFDRCIIKFPKGKEIIVNFNDEVGLMAVVRKDHESSFNKGDPISIHHVNEILEVLPPTVDDKRVGFVFLHVVNGRWEIFFDFTPNDDHWKDTKEDWALGKAIAESYQNLLEEKTILVFPGANELLQSIGLWPAPALISYPLSKIIKQLSEKRRDAAIKTLVDHCSIEFLEKLSKKWYDNEHFAEKKIIFSQAITGHKLGLYTLTIPTLLPLVEGIITDWAIANVPDGDYVPWRQNSKTKKFQDIVLTKHGSVTYNIIVNSAISFILNGPILSSFKQWLDDVQTEFPNRHVVGHGKFNEKIYSKENSIKLFLLIDTIFHIISEGEDSKV